MAISICKAQIPLLCQLCNIQREMKWKCIECELLMCDNCKNKVHSRMKTADKHNIITTQDVGIDLSDRLKTFPRYFRPSLVHTQPMYRESIK